MDIILQNPKLAQICQENGISYLGVFGSYARDESTTDSDVDLLVKFTRPTGYFSLVTIENAFKEALNKEVDLVTENGLSKRIKPYILNDLKTLYGSK